MAWGICVDKVAIALALALTIECYRISSLRWALDTRHFYRIADFSSALFAIVVVYQLTRHGIYAIYHILALLPLCVFPLLAAARYSTVAAIPRSAFFLTLRRRIRAGLEQERHINFEFVYVLICILASSTGDVAPSAYMAGATALLFGALVVRRPHRYTLLKWGATVCLVMAVAYSLHLSFARAHRFTESAFVYWFNQFAWIRTDPDRTRTALGFIGRLKLSDRIRIRLEAPLSIPLPLVLHEASYSTFNLGTWSQADSRFTSIDPELGTQTWRLAPSTHTQATYQGRMTIVHRSDVGVAPLPYGATSIRGSELIEIQRNQYGTALVEALPGNLSYGLSWRPGSISAPPPSSRDVIVPENYLQHIGEIAEEAGVEGLSAAAAVTRTREFFRENFYYSLIQSGFYPGRTPLAHFLLEERKGHCEYFATATTLLLRYAGVPARYAVGYVVDEYSGLEKAFVARARHAHSWVEAYVNDAWIVVDTTPSQWYGLEQNRANSWQTVQDIWSWMQNNYQRFRRRELMSDRTGFIWLVIPLAVILLWRLRKQIRRVDKATPTRLEARAGTEQGELHKLCALLLQQGHRLGTGQTLRSFFSRAMANDRFELDLDRLLELYERSRYTTSGLSTAEVGELRAVAAQFSQRYE